MSGWKAKRFWAEARVVEVANGYTVHLDHRPVRTPAKSALIVPTRALAEAIAAEWQAQEGQIDPNKMPFTRSANAAIDKVVPQQAEVVRLLAAENPVLAEVRILSDYEQLPRVLAARVLTSD